MGIPEMEESDEALMALIQHHNHRAFSLLVRRHTDRFYALAYRILFNQAEAEDIVQDAFLKIWDKPSLWSPDRGVRFTTWFYRIVVNACYDQNKRKASRYHDSVDFDQMETQSSGPEEGTLYSQVEKALMALPDRQRAAIALCFYQGLSNKEAADVLGLKLKALQSLLIRGKQSLKTSLGLAEERRYESQ